MTSASIGGSPPIHSMEEHSVSPTTTTPAADSLTAKCLEIAQGILANPEKKLDSHQVATLREHKTTLKKEFQQREKKLNSRIGKVSSFLRRTVTKKNRRHDELDRIREEYSQVKKAYQEVVEASPSLQRAKEIRKMMKLANAQLSEAGGDWKKVDTAFAAKFDELAEAYKMLGNLKGMLGPKTTENKAQWNSFRDKLVRGTEQVRTSDALSTRQITWLHGTRSPALAVMLATDRTLHPTGELLQHNIIPLSGELGQGITDSGVNRANLSGTPLSRMGVEVTTEYATSFKASSQEEWEHLSETRLRQILDITEQTLENDPELQGRFASGTKFDWLSTGLYLERLKVIDPEFQDKVPQLEELIQKLITECKANNRDKLVPFLEKLLANTRTEPFIQPSQEIRDCVTDSFPIILSSQTVRGTLIADAFAAETLDEHLVSGSLSLDEIQVAFTDTQYVDRLQGYVDAAGLKIEVMDFTALSVLGSQAQERGNPSLSP